MHQEYGDGVNESGVLRLPFLYAMVVGLVSDRVEEADKIHRVDERKSHHNGSKESEKRKHGGFK